MANAAVQAQGDARAAGVHGFGAFFPLARLPVVADDRRRNRKRETLAAAAVLVGGINRFKRGLLVEVSIYGVEVYTQVAGRRALGNRAGRCGVTCRAGGGRVAFLDNDEAVVFDAPGGTG
jgi:hypothetical protein